MGHVRTPQADSDLDELWYYVASGSNSVEIADRLVESITSRFLILGGHPNIGRARDEDLSVCHEITIPTLPQRDVAYALVRAVSRLVSTSVRLKESSVATSGRRGTQECVRHVEIAMLFLSRP